MVPLCGFFLIDFRFVELLAVYRIRISLIELELRFYLYVYACVRVLFLDSNIRITVVSLIDELMILFGRRATRLNFWNR